MDNRLDCFKNSMAAGRFKKLTIIDCSVSGSKHLSTGRSEIKIFSKIKPLKKLKLTHKFDHNWEICHAGTNCSTNPKHTILSLKNI